MSLTLADPALSLRGGAGQKPDCRVGHFIIIERVIIKAATGGGHGPNAPPLDPPVVTDELNYVLYCI